MKESLNPLSTVLGDVKRKEEMRKVSRDCYVSYKGNRHSVPWKYAGKECKIIEESSIIKIEIDSVVATSHEIITGTGRISRRKEHFEGLLNAVREENSVIYEQHVETRDLKKYEEVS